MQELVNKFCKLEEIIEYEKLLWILIPISENFSLNSEGTKKTLFYICRISIISNIYLISE